MDEATPEKLPPYVIEGARSSRSRCKTCRRTITKGGLRIGVLIEGPYGVGYLWHHLRCAARRRLDQVEEAYQVEAWNHAKEPPSRVPALDELRKHAEQAQERRTQRRELPYAELDPSGRARCKHCGEPMDKGSLRFVLGRSVEFGNQVRVGPIQVHPHCVEQALQADDSATESEGFAAAVRKNSAAEVPSETLEAALTRIGGSG